ncbi:MAG: type IV pilus assembly protein PilM [Planctomycetota bacterium]|jgi:type IV pilus assembly protein PilM
MNSRTLSLNLGVTTLDWKKCFNFAQPEILGLDIGSSEVRLIRLHKEGAGYAVTAASAVGVETSRDNHSQDPTNTINAIRQCVESAGAEGTMAVCGVSGPEVAVRYFNFPGLRAEEAKSAVLLEAAQVCPFNIDESVVDYQVVPNGEDNISGVLVAATNELVRKKTEILEQASLKCVLMDVDGLALLNCFNGFHPDQKDRTQPGRTIAILNVGNSHTTLAIMGDNGLPYIRDISYAGDNIIEEIARENNLSVQDVKNILFSTEDPAKSDTQLDDSLVRACEKLAVDITETLRYYAVQEKHAVVEKIYVCGGFALVKGFAELLDERIPARAVFWDPFENVRCAAGRPGQEVLAAKGPEMAVAAGLAMRSI